MSLAKLANRKKAEAAGQKPDSSAGAPETPPEMLQALATFVESSPKESTSKLAKIAASDMGAYTNIMAIVQEQLGPAACDLIHGPVQERLDKFQKAKGESKTEKEKPVVDTPPEEVVENLMKKAAEAFGITDEEVKEAEEAPPEESGPSPEERAATQQAAAEQDASKLVQDMGPSPGVPSDKVPIKVDSEAMAKTEAAGADGMVQDGMVYLHPDEYNPGDAAGQRLVYEETLHFVQQQHALTGAGAEISPMPVVENEAQTLADAYARGESIAPPQEIMGPGDIATSGGEAIEPPDSVTLNFGGLAVEVQVPDASQQTATIPLGQSPLPGLTLGDANLVFDPDWIIQSGSVDASFQIGNYVTMDTVQLTVERSGAVQCSVQGANLAVSDLIAASIDLQISGDGITGTATVTHEQMVLPLGIILLEGFLRVSLDSEGNISAVGNASFDIPGIGQATLNASLDNETIGGTVSLIVESPIQLAGGVTLKEASLSGNYTRDGFVMSGSSLVNVNEWAESRITGSFDFPSMSWSANGTVTQLQPMTFGELEVSDGMLSVALDRGNLVSVGGGGRFTTPQFTGSLGGTYDVNNQAFSGEATAELLEEITLASGARLERAAGGAVIENNQLVTVTASASAVMPFQGEDTFQVTATDCVYQVQPGEFSGTGNVTLMRPLQFAVGGFVVEIDPSASADVTVVANEVTEVKGGLGYKVSDEMGELGTGNLELTFAGDSVSGQGSFALSNDYGVPSREEGPAMVKAGSALTVVIVDGSPESVQFSSVQVEIANLGTGGEGVVTGSVDGSLDIASMAFTGSASASVTTGWVEDTAFGTIGLIDGGTVTANLDGNELQTINVENVGIMAEFTAGGQPISVDGTINGTWDHQTSMASGTLAIQLSDDVSIPMGGDEVVLKGGSGGEATIDANNLTQATFNFELEYNRAGEPFLAGGVEGGVYDAATGTVNCTGKLSLQTELEAGAGEWSVKVPIGAEITATVEASELKEITSDSLKIEVWQDEKVLEGELTGVTLNMDEMNFSGGGTATVVVEKDFGIELNGWQFILMPTEGPTVEFTLVDNDLTSIGGNVKVQARKDGGSIDIELGGTYTPESKEFTGSGSCTVNQPIEVGSAGEFDFEIQGGTGLDVTVEANEITEIVGTLNGAVKWDGDFLEINAEVTYRTANDGEVDVKGSAKITGEKQIFGPVNGYEFWLIPSEGFVAEVLVETNELKEVSAEVSFKIMDGESEPLLTGSANGTYSAETNLFNGGGDLRLGRDVELGSDSLKIYFLAGSGGNATVADSKLESLGGTLKAEIESDGEKLVKVEADGEYNAVEKKLTRLEGNATLLKPLELLGGKVRLVGASGHAKIIDNELVAAGGQADVEIDGFEKVEGKIEFEWSKESGEDEYTGSAELGITVNEQLSGTAKVELLPGGEFKVSGELEYKLNDMITGMIGIEVGNDLNPILNGRLEVNDVELIPGRDLFGMEIPVLPMMAIPLGIPGANLVLGCNAGMKASIMPVTFSTAIEISNFKPLEMNMPDFQAEAGLSLGLEFSAGIKPYVGLSAGVQGAQVGSAVEGELKLTVPITVNPMLTLRGGPSGFSGEFELGVVIAPSLDLMVRPFLFAELAGQMARHDMTEWTVPLGELFRWEWSKTYKFGDEGDSASDGASTTEAAPTAGEQSFEENADGEVGDFSASAGGKSPGGPDLDAGGDMSQGGGEGGEASEMQQRMDEVKELADKVASVAFLFSTVMEIVAVASILPPWGLSMVPAYLCYRIFIKGDLTLDKLKTAISDLFSLLTEAFDWIMANLPQWVKDVYDWITSGASNILGDMGEWLSDNLQALGDEAVQLFKDAGEWGASIIEGAGEWAMEAAGWAMEALSDAGEAVGDAAADAWDWLTG